MVNHASCFYIPEGRDEDGREVFLSTPHTTGPWSGDSQHGGPPAALLGRAVEGLESRDDGVRTISRFAMDLLGPVPVGRLAVSSRVLRPGRSVDLCEAELGDLGSGRVVARGTAWRSSVRGDGPVVGHAEPPVGPEHGVVQEPPPSWGRGYLDAIEWRWITGAVDQPGPAVVWMRPRMPLVADEPITPLQRLLTCVDSASGASAVLDIATWAFMNTDLTVHALRPLEGEWVGLVARTVTAGGSVGTALAQVFDGRGLVAHSAQALLVAPR